MSQAAQTEKPDPVRGRIFCGFDSNPIAREAADSTKRGHIDIYPRFLVLVIGWLGMEDIRRNRAQEAISFEQPT